MCQEPLGSRAGALLLLGHQNKSNHISRSATALCNEHAWPQGKSLMSWVQWHEVVLSWQPALCMHVELNVGDGLEPVRG